MEVGYLCTFGLEKVVITSLLRLLTVSRTLENQ